VWLKRYGNGISIVEFRKPAGRVAEWKPAHETSERLRAL
jgi:hypothetical protein